MRRKRRNIEVWSSGDALLDILVWRSGSALRVSRRGGSLPQEFWRGVAAVGTCRYGDLEARCRRCLKRGMEL